MKLGATFSRKYCTELGLDWQKTYERLLEMDFKVLRLCAYWDLLEPQQGEFDFSWLEWQLDKARERKIDVVLAMGRKVPRWPEFHEPEWALVNESTLMSGLASYLETTVNRFKSHAAISRWQIENEPFYSFGHSEFPLSEANVAAEIELVRSLSARPIVVTDSGEWGNWKLAARYGDQVGVNIYRIVYEPQTRRYVKYLFWPGFYRYKARKIKAHVLVAELQAEPWGPSEKTKFAREDWRPSISGRQLLRNFDLVRRAKFNEIWLWGPEWWLYLEQMHGITEFQDAWERIKLIS